MSATDFAEDSQRAQLFQRLREKALAAVSTSPATPSQLRSWSNRARNSYGTITLWWAVRLRDDSDVDDLRAAFKALTNRHSSLRTSFALGADTLEQSIHGDVEPDVQEIVVADDAAAATALVDTYSQPFDLGSWSLVRVRLIRTAGDGAMLVIAADHIVCDLWSLLTVVDELGTLLAARRRNTVADLPPVAQYYQFARWQAEMLASPEGQALWTLWDDRFRDGVTATELLPAPVRAAAAPATTRLVSYELDCARCAHLRTLARRLDTSVGSLMLSLISTVIHRYSGDESVRIGTVLTGRSRTEFRSSVGDFANAVPIGQDLSAGMSFAEVVRRTNAEMAEAIRRQDIPLPLIAARYAANGGGGDAPLFRHLFLYQKPHLATNLIALPGVTDMARTVTWGGGTVEPLALSQHGQEDDLNDLTFEILDIEERIFAGLRFNDVLFDETFVRALAASLDTLIDTVVEDPDRPLGAIELLSDADRERIVHGFNDTTRSFDGPATVFEMFERQVRATPHAIALRERGRSLSYAELDARADRIAAYLINHGVGRDGIVALYMERSFEMVVAIVAVWKAGGAYLPIDPENPAAHGRAIVADAAPVAALTQQRLTERFAGLDPACPVLAIDAELPETAAPGRRAPPQPDALAYVIYTSGSTGTPKGVLCAHDGLTNRIEWMQAEYALRPDDVVLQKTPYTFDVSVWEFAWTLSAGATLVIARPGGHRDSAYLRDIIEDELVTTVHFVPSMLSAFVEGLEPGRCPSLARVMCSGEALSVPLQTRFFQVLGAELHNLYGPTEASIDVTAWQCSPTEPDQRTVPIGRPIANMRAYVVHPTDKLCAVGVPGELCLAGVGLARGYLNRPELTAERFVPCPWESGRMYRTGDLARWHPDGTLEYLGRLDHQIKLRGFRIELGEIEAVLASHPEVEFAAVTVVMAPGGDQKLYAYHKTRSAVAEDELHAFTAGSLPPYMVPSYWHRLDHLPTTSSGKLDRKGLPAPVFQTASADLDLPVTSDEKALARIWSELLGVAQVGRRDDFFALGGDSLHAVRLAAHVRSHFELDLSLRDLFERPTLCDVAASLRGATASPASGVAEDDHVTLLI